MRVLHGGSDWRVSLMATVPWRCRRGASPADSLSRGAAGPADRHAPPPPPSHGRAAQPVQARWRVRRPAFSSSAADDRSSARHRRLPRPQPRGGRRYARPPLWPPYRADARRLSPKCAWGRRARQQGRLLLTSAHRDPRAREGHGRSMGRDPQHRNLARVLPLREPGGSHGPVRRAADAGPVGGPVAPVGGPCRAQAVPHLGPADAWLCLRRLSGVGCGCCPAGPDAVPCNKDRDGKQCRRREPRDRREPRVTVTVVLGRWAAGRGECGGCSACQGGPVRAARTLRGHHGADQADGRGARVARGAAAQERLDARGRARRHAQGRALASSPPSPPPPQQRPSLTGSRPCVPRRGVRPSATGLQVPRL